MGIRNLDIYKRAEDERLKQIAEWRNITQRCGTAPTLMEPVKGTVNFDSIKKKAMEKYNSEVNFDTEMAVEYALKLAFNQ